jgi:hypothetical protein
MDNHHKPSQLTELDRLLITNGGWFYSENRDRFASAAEPRPHRILRAGLARRLRDLASWIDVGANTGHRATSPFG